MQKVTLICVGKLKEKFYAQATAEYAKRLSRFCKLEIVELPEQKLPESPAPAEIEQALAREAALIEEKLPKGGAVIGIREELGDALFILCKIAQMSGVDPEDALHRACDKYQGRFRRVADAADRPLSAYTEAEKITLWEQAKEN